MSTDYRLNDLRAQARHARQRYALYKARAYGLRPTTDSRMRELQRECEGAEARLRAAEAEEERLVDVASRSDPGRQGSGEKGHSAAESACVTGRSSRP